MHPIVGRVLGIIFGAILILMCDWWVRFVGIIEFVTCSILIIFYYNKCFIWTKVCALVILVPILMWRKLWIWGIVLLIYEVVSISRGC